MIKSLTTAAVLSALLGLSAFGQSGAGAPQNKPPQPSPGETMAPTDEGPGPQEESPSVAPVLWVSSVETLSSTHGPQLDVIRARGLTSTEGWQKGELIPISRGASPDGMLDLIFVAQAPSDSPTTTGFPGIEAIFTIEPGHPYKGVRIHSATNRITVKTIPGYTEGPPAPDDCSKCVGKYFIGKGETAPAGVNVSDTIREESLPKMLHVVRAGDGVGKIDSDPNRLTLVLGEDGRIVIAVWD